MVKFIRIALDVRYFSDKPIEIRQIENSLRFYVEGCEFSPAYKTHKWDGYYRFYDKRLRTFNYGLLGMVISGLEKNNMLYRIENDFAPIRMKSRIDNSLWSHQKKGILHFLQKPYGTIKIPTRGGKTKLASELIRLIEPAATLFVVDSQLLFEQAVNDIGAHLKINRRQIGRIRGDEFTLKPITVAMIQTLQSIKYGVARLRRSTTKKTRNNEPVSKEVVKQHRKERLFRSRSLDTYLKSVDFLIVDEIHEYSSDERIKTPRACINAQACLFLSATPEKSEGVINNIRIKSLGGNIIYEVEERELKAAGVLAKEEIILVSIDHNVNRNIQLKEKDTYDTYEQQIIVKNERRNNIITNIIQICRHLELKTLVLFSYVEHGKFIQRITGDELVTGGTKLDQRMKILKAFLKRKAGVLLATNIFNKGLTLPDVQVLINAAGGLEQSLIIQKKGRTLGTTATKKKALTIDMVDIAEYFSDHSLSRIQVYEEKVGIENISIFSSSDSAFYEDLREFLNNWKEDE